MSSFLCDPQTIADATGAIANADPHMAYVELANLNADGYATRYAHIPGTLMDVARFREGASMVNVVRSSNPLKAYMALSCLLYQASEGDIEESDTFKKWEDACTELAHTIANRVCDKAGIGWDSHHEAGAPA